MFQFVVTNVFMISVGAILYFVIRTLPRIEPDNRIVETKGFLERFIVSKIPERVDKAVNSFLFKFLRKLKVTLLKIDNLVGRQIKRIQPPEMNGNGENGDKATIDFAEIKGKNKGER